MVLLSMAQAEWIGTINFDSAFSAGTLVVKHNVNKNNIQLHTSSNVARNVLSPSRAQ